MIIEKIESSDLAKFRLALESVTRSIGGRGVSFVISTQAANVGSITINVTGAKGTAQKVMTITYNELLSSWVIYCDGTKYTINSFTDISTIAKKKITSLSNILQRI